MKARRRWLQFSLRGFLAVLTIGCLWLGWKVERAREKREAVKAIEAMGGAVHFDWEPGSEGFAGNDFRWLYPVFLGKKRTERGWLASLVGDEFFHEVDSVIIRFGTDRPIKTSAEMETRLRETLPYLRRLPGLTQVLIEIDPPPALRWRFCEDEVTAFKKALPHCEVSRVSPHPKMSDTPIVIIPFGTDSTATSNAQQ